MNPSNPFYNLIDKNNPFYSKTQTRELPNGGGSYSIPSTTPGSQLFSPPSMATQTSTPPTLFGQQEQTAPPKKSKYMNPATGKYYTPEEYANSVALKIPASKGTGDVTQYAGDALANPDESTEALNTRATNMNNTRNDIATGTTDPYKVGKDSGIAYSPQELAAIEKAYAGIYDPALNDVFSRLKTREEEAQRDADREDRIFATNESIRQWRATTGSKIDTENDTKSDLFTQSQLNNGATNARLTVGPDGAFEQLSNDLKNFFINPPKEVDPVTGKSYDSFIVWDNLIKQVEDGKMSVKEAADEIESSGLSNDVKHYYLDQLPLEEKEKEGYFKRLWGAITGN